MTDEFAAESENADILGNYWWDDIEDSRLADDACEPDIDEENEYQEEKGYEKGHSRAMYPQEEIEEG